MKTRKKLIIMTIVIAVIFLMLNCVWFFGMRLKYFDYMKTVEKIDDDGLVRYKSVVNDNYYVSVRPVGYLSYESGYLTISRQNKGDVVIDEDGDMKYGDVNITFYIWPEFGNSYSMGVMVFDKNSAYQILFDGDLNVADDFNDEEFLQIANEYLDKYREEILDLMHLAENLWGYELTEL